MEAVRWRRVVVQTNGVVKHVWDNGRKRFYQWMMPEEAENVRRLLQVERQQKLERLEELKESLPVRYSWPHTFQRLRTAEVDPKPGHLVQRRWLQKGKV